MTFRYRAIIAMLGIGWGASFFFNEILLRELGPFSMSLGRISFGAFGCWIWLVLRREDMRVSWAHARLLAVFGLFQYTLPLKIYPCAQQFFTSSSAGIVNAMTPITVVLISQA